jgi:hypothetical protein
MERFYTTTAIDYVNGAPHIGHAYEKILTDVIYRHFTQRCEDTYFFRLNQINYDEIFNIFFRKKNIIFAHQL